MKVNEFSIGMGPAIFKKQKGETLYCLATACPSAASAPWRGRTRQSADPRALENQGFWAKLLIFAAGAAMNFLTGLLIILCLYGGAKAFCHPGDRRLCPGLSLGGDSMLAGDKVYRH